MRMTVALLVCASLVLAMGTVAMAEKAAESKPAMLRGKIKSVDADNNKIVVLVRAKRGAEPKEVTVTTDANTKVSIDKVADKKVSDLKADMFVVVTPTEGTATEIKASTKGPGRGGKKGDKGGDKGGAEG